MVVKAGVVVAHLLTHKIELAVAVVMVEVVES